MRQPQYVRIPALAKTLETAEKSAERMLQSGVISFETPKEEEAFKKGVQVILDLIKSEYSIE